MNPQVANFEDGFVHRKKEEGRRKKEEGRGKREEVGGRYLVVVGGRCSAVDGGVRKNLSPKTYHLKPIT
ncbi:MAG: hypothetical protein HC786_20025 [Richelia sp. CSU_2_1]|nr:hypothetical protein [Richelia sp. CSU_2_1]